jgi:carboxypeptidase Taq
MLNELKSITRECQLLAESAAVLGWDQETYIPPAAVPERGEQLALLQTLAHERLTSSRTGELLDGCGCSDEAPGGTIAAEDTDRAYLRELYRRYRREIRLPSRLVADFARAASAGQAAWVKAREADDFALFRPNLETLLGLVVEKAEAVGYADHPYDALIDEFEPWMTTAKIDKVFTPLEESLTRLAARIAEAPQVDDSFLHRQYPLDAQRQFARRVVSDLGYDFERGRIDETAHPFTTTLGGDDVRITGRFRENYLGTGLFGLIHEFGHALYEQGFDQHIKGNILAAGTSLGIHESQSRTWENAVARGLPFWEHYLPVAKEYFPSQLDGISLETFFKGINRVAPGMIRIDADEVTYGLHVILRFRLELALVSGNLTVADLPAAWREMSGKLLGIEPVRGSEAELQDIHWSMGALGYFPTYALGNLYGAQFFHSMEEEIPGMDDRIREGEFAPLRSWLNRQIHRHGVARSADELCLSVSGEDLKADYFLSYLERKFAKVYSI